MSMFVKAIGKMKISEAEAKTRSLLTRYREDDRGVLIIFGLFMLCLMLIAAGMAVDVMRFETTRTKLQNTVDRAALAAADLNQKSTPSEVVADYLAKEGMSSYLVGVDVQEDTLNKSWRTVEVKTKAIMPTYFMNMVGISSLQTPAAGKAEERIGDVEISLVLDVSGSMGQNNRMVNLKPAAKNFLDLMFDAVEEDRLSVSLVQFDTQVSAGPELLSYLNVSNEHGYSDCIDFADADYNTAAITPAQLLQRSGHIDARNKSSNPGDGNRECDPSEKRDIIAISQDKSALKNRIDDMQPRSFTSIELGAKWGIALLDPAFNSVVNEMVDDDKVEEVFDDRPMPYTDSEAMKVLVLMTDGENTSEYRLNNGYYSGLSNTWINIDDKKYSIYNPDTNQYYIPHLKGLKDRNGNPLEYRDTPWGDGQWDQCSYSKKTGVTTCNIVPDGGDAVRMTFPELWNDMSIRYHADYLASGFDSDFYNRYKNDVAGLVDNAEKNSLLNKVCTAAKNKGVLIYTIGFEVPAAGVQPLKNCATADGFYFAATPENIQSKFATIASSINQLRLTH